MATALPPRETGAVAREIRPGVARRRCRVKSLMTVGQLRLENTRHAGTGGRSEENKDLGFRPAFLDFETQRIYLSCFADGRAAPFHLLEGLPEEVIIDRSPTGRVVAAKATLISGFVRNGFFYTRAAAARAVSEWSPPRD